MGGRGLRCCDRLRAAPCRERTGLVPLHPSHAGAASPRACASGAGRTYRGGAARPRGDAPVGGRTDGVASLPAGALAGARGGRGQSLLRARARRRARCRGREPPSVGRAARAADSDGAARRPAGRADRTGSDRRADGGARRPPRRWSSSPPSRATTTPFASAEDAATYADERGAAGAAAQLHEEAWRFTASDDGRRVPRLFAAVEGLTRAQRGGIRARARG